jgi:small redox-active disulfide protein 2
MKITVVGSGCQTCKRLYEITQKVVIEMGVEDKVEYVTGDKGMQKMIELGAMSSPIIVVDEKIAMTGFTPNTSKIKAAIQKAATGK